MRVLERALLTNAPPSALFIRLLVGGVFLSEGIQKFLFPDTLGIGRFTKIGIPDPALTAPFVGIVEIVFGSFLIAGFLTRLSAIPLVINICVAIATTKIPMLHAQGFWAMAHEARTDYSMLLGLLFLGAAGGGPVSLDRMIHSRRPPP